jgi:hypothetical protein
MRRTTPTARPGPPHAPPAGRRPAIGAGRRSGTPEGVRRPRRRLARHRAAAAVEQQGAWRETAEWAWELSPDAAALALKVEGGKFLRSAKLRPDRNPGGFILDAVLVDGPSRSFVGQAAPDGKLVLAAQGPASDAGPRRDHDHAAASGTRVLLLLEGEVGDSGRFARLAESATPARESTSPPATPRPSASSPGAAGPPRSASRGRDLLGLLLRLQGPVRGRPRRRPGRGVREGRGPAAQIAHRTSFPSGRRPENATDNPCSGADQWP